MCVQLRNKPINLINVPFISPLSYMYMQACVHVHVHDKYYCACPQVVSWGVASMGSCSNVQSGRGKAPWPSSRSFLLTRNTGTTWHWSSTTHGRCVCMCVHAHTHVHACACICLSVHVHVCMCVCVSVCVCVCECVCVCSPVSHVVLSSAHQLSCFVGSLVCQSWFL